MNIQKKVSSHIFVLKDLMHDKAFLDKTNKLLEEAKHKDKIKANYANNCLLIAGVQESILKLKPIIQGYIDDANRQLLNDNSISFIKDVGFVNKLGAAKELSASLVTSTKQDVIHLTAASTTNFKPKNEDFFEEVRGLMTISSEHKDKLVIKKIKLFKKQFILTEPKYINFFEGLLSQTLSLSWNHKFGSDLLLNLMYGCSFLLKPDLQNLNDSMKFVVLVESQTTDEFEIMHQFILDQLSYLLDIKQINDWINNKKIIIRRVTELNGVQFYQDAFIYALTHRMNIHKFKQILYTIGDNSSLSISIANSRDYKDETLQLVKLISTFPNTQLCEFREREAMVNPIVKILIDEL